MEYIFILKSVLKFLSRSCKKIYRTIRNLTKDMLLFLLLILIIYIILTTVRGLF